MSAGEKPSGGQGGIESGQLEFLEEQGRAGKVDDQDDAHDPEGDRSQVEPKGAKRLKGAKAISPSRTASLSSVAGEAGDQDHGD